MAESRQFWEVGPALADRGFRAIAVDLPGHGHSEPHLAGGLAEYGDFLAQSVPARPDLALGHSMGAMVVAEALPRLQPRRAVYVDVPFQPSTSSEQRKDDPLALAAAFEEAKARRTASGLAQTRPWWKPRDREVEVVAARLFDVPTAVALELATDHASLAPPALTIPSLLIHAEPSDFVPDERIAQLRQLGFATRAVPGAGHSVWYGFFDPFMSALDDWLIEQPTN